jgi:hypothetical protein
VRTVVKINVKNGLTYQTVFGLKEGCIGKLDRCNDRTICRKLPVNETIETLVTSTDLSVDCLKLKIGRMSNSCEVLTSYAGKTGVLLHW